MSDSPPDDVALVRRAQSGDRDAYAALFDRFQQPVLNYLYHLVGGRQAAEDVAQDAFIRAYERIGLLGPPWNFKGWIYRIAGNLAMNHLKRERRLVESDEPELMAEPPTTRRPSERRVVRGELQQSVRRALEGIPAPLRQALVLREMNGLSYEEMADALSVSYDNARQLVHRARMRFRDEYGLGEAIAEGAVRCRQLGDLLSSYHDGLLTGQDRERVEAHLAACDQCRKKKDDMRMMAAWIGGLPLITPPAAWRASVLKMLEMVKPSPGAGLAAVHGGRALERARYFEGQLLEARDLEEEQTYQADRGSRPRLSRRVVVRGVLGVTLLGLAVLAIALVVSGGQRRSLERAGGLAPGSSAPTTPPLQEVHPSAQAVQPIATTPPPSGTVPPTPPTQSHAIVAGVIQNANCRQGPGLAYPVVTSVAQGEMVPVEGRNANHTWWWVLLGSIGHCWVSGSAVELTGGDPSLLPVIPAPPLPPPPTPTLTPTRTPTPVTIAPNAPSNLIVADASCPAASFTVTLQWTDNAKNETGYRVYRGGVLIATLPADSSGYTDNPPCCGPITYGVEAYNGAGASKRAQVTAGECVY